ncbi:3-oxoacyl-ACP synthase [Sphingomonas psychrolutea]|uniref:Ferritin-like domain-containing protein n=1 Tax=Sphingomonas psychrolutea TaxID=1259676 RepID=A0ABQ1GG43_9SPHN|nr:3-oxoacyl-ACP synthase [Sphingomonas psychrolutea]GGA42858.1 hypothetical protein GCM10011395_11420 [Sphingomonas psychrolutea]
MAGLIASAPGVCFPAAHRLPGGTRALPRIGLGDAQVAALAVLVPLLGCGEEAAALAFDGLAGLERDPVAAATLRTIGAEEREHDALLTSLLDVLPTIAEATTLQQAARRFHVRLGIGRPAAHLGRIAAIDAAVCTVLARLLRPGNPLAQDTVTARMFGRIHRDEARHVRVSRGLATARLARAELDDLAAGARMALADILLLAGGAFETLGVDAQALHRDLANVPNGLFAP